jgi:cobalt-zinc-cadmium efflux system outer membrane protein
MIGLPSVHVAKMTKPNHPSIHSLSIQGCLLRTSLWLAILWHGTIVRTLGAEPPSPLSWTIETLAEGVCRHNKELAAARWVIESAKARSRQAGKLTNPRITTSSSLNTINPENMQGFSLQQSFPITARLRLEKNVASLNIEQAEKEVQWMAHQKVMEAMESATRWLALHERKEILKEQITLASLAVIQIKELELKRPGLESSIHSLENQMRSLLGQQAEEPFRLEAIWKPMAIPSASPLNTANHPAFGVLHTEADIHRTMVALEQSRKWQDWTLGLSHQRSVNEDEPFGLERNRWLGFQLSIPLPWWQKNQGAVAASQANLKKTEASAEALKLQMENDADSTMARLIQGRAQYLMLRDELIPNREKHHQSLEQAVRAGERPMESLITSLEGLLTLKLSLLEVIETFHLNHYRYLYLTQDLSRHHD